MLAAVAASMHSKTFGAGPLSANLGGHSTSLADASTDLRLSPPNTRGAVATKAAAISPADVASNVAANTHIETSPPAALTSNGVSEYSTAVADRFTTERRWRLIAARRAGSSQTCGLTPRRTLQAER